MRLKHIYRCKIAPIKLYNVVNSCEINNNSKNNFKKCVLGFKPLYLPVEGQMQDTVGVLGLHT